MRRTVTLTLDLLIIALAMPLGLLLRENLIFDAELANHFPYLAMTLAVAVPVLRLLGVDRSLWRYSTIDDHLRIAIAMVLILLAATLLTFVYNRLEGISRSVPVLHAILALVGMVSARVAMRASCGAQATPKPFEPITRKPHQSVLLVGLNALAELYVKAIDELSDNYVRVVGIMDHDVRTDGMRVQGLPVFGGGRCIQDVVNDLSVHGVFIDRLVITIPSHRLDEAARRDIDAFTARSTIPVEFFAENIGIVNWAGIEQAVGVADMLAAEERGPDVSFLFSPAELANIAARPYWRLKRAVDIAVSLTLIMALWPIAALVAVVVAMDVGLPVLFWQVRPGVGGKPFALYKFRTMQAARDRNGRLRSDAERLSGIGRFLRATRLDELPQLWNILVGEMSFIGPRPLLPVDQSPAFAARLLVRPGLTGWGQIMGGRDIPPADKAALDIWYVRNASFALDAAIIKGTVPMVLRGERVDHVAIDRAWQELRRSGICRRSQPGPPQGSGLADGGQAA
ncbi:MAG: sugar transferase [Hyphomicrobiaceae bacterium]|nr:sugar transferase [Hyphomicrobiaceae bacterium]